MTSNSQTTLPNDFTTITSPSHQKERSDSGSDNVAEKHKLAAAGDDVEKEDSGYNALAPRVSVREGELDVPEKFHKLGWVRLTVCLIVEAIALGSLSIPSAFATLGMVAGVILTVGIGCIAIYTSYLVGQVKLLHPHVSSYADAVGLIWGRFGFELTGAMFAIFLVLVTGSHTLTGTIAFIDIVKEDNICALVWGVVSAILLFLVALPPTFHEFAILGYIDFVSIVIAILVTIIATGVQAGKQVGGLEAVPWSAWPPEHTTLYDAFLSVTNIIFAYSFAVCQYSFMDEMHTPKDYVKSIWALGIIEIVIYTLVGALVYAFVGESVQSPALLSAGSVVSRVAFGIALPVIFISGSINSTVVGRYIMNRAFEHSRIRYINTPKAWAVWISLIATITVIAWVIAEAIPFFNDLLGIISSLFISGFSFYFPALFWFYLLKEGGCFSSRKNIMLTIVNGGVFVFGVAVLGLGTYASVQSIIENYKTGTGIRSPFTCKASSYA